MIERLKSWFASRSAREQRLLLVMAALAVVTLLWGGIIRPVTDTLSSERERHADAVLRVADAQARVATVQALLRDRPTALSGPIDAIVRTRANEAGFALGSVTAQGRDAVQIQIASARPAALMRWISDLEAAGILVDSLGLANNGDQTVAAQMTLRARGQ